MTKSVFSERYAILLSIIVQARKEAGLTQADLAARLSKPQSYVSKAERGERRIDVIEFVYITEALGVNPIDILSKLLEKRDDKIY